MKKFISIIGIIFLMASNVFAGGAIRLILPANTVSLEVRNVLCSELNLDRATFLVREASAPDAKDEVRIQFRKIRDDYDAYGVYQLKKERDEFLEEEVWRKDRRLENDFSGSYNVVFLSKRNDTCTLDFFSGAKTDFSYNMITGVSDNGDLGIGGDSKYEKGVYGVLKRLQE